MSDKMQPFPNGTSMGVFQDQNCQNCKKFNYDNPDKSCSLEVEIGFAYMGDGKINKKTASKIGWDGENYLNSKCKEIEDPNIVAGL